MPLAIGPGSDNYSKVQNPFHLVNACSSKYEISKVTWKKTEHIISPRIEITYKSFEIFTFNFNLCFIVRTSYTQPQTITSFMTFFSSQNTLGLLLFSTQSCTIDFTVCSIILFSLSSFCALNMMSRGAKMLAALNLLREKMDWKMYVNAF